jgi:hypothetical protein
MVHQITIPPQNNFHSHDFSPSTKARRFRSSKDMKEHSSQRFIHLQFSVLKTDNPFYTQLGSSCNGSCFANVLSGVNLWT